MTTPIISTNDQYPPETDLIDFNLSISAEQRLLNHQLALETINELLKAREQIYGESKPSSQTPPGK